MMQASFSLAGVGLALIVLVGIVGRRISARSRKSSQRSLIPAPTREFYRLGRQTEGYSLWDFVHGIIYLRWPYLYIGIGKGDHPAAKVLGPVYRLARRLLGLERVPPARSHSVTLASGTVADNYHGKVTPLNEARRLVTINEPIQIEDLEQVIPYIQARAIIQEHPDHLVALECPCRAARKEAACRPLDVCLIVGEPFASLVMTYHAGRARWISQDEALKILQEEDDRGHVHHAFFKDAMLGRFYAICNCCACCCGAMGAHQRGTPMLASSGFVAEVDAAECIACESCAPFCQFGALTLADGSTHVDQALCMGCGVCLSKCPQEAITLRQEPTRGTPLNVTAIVKESAQRITS